MLSLAGCQFSPSGPCLVRLANGQSWIEDRVIPELPERESARSTLLIADDDPVVRSMLGMALEGSFEIVAAAQDCDEAVARAVETQPDAALIDVNMPGGGGRRAVREIVEASPQTAIVVLSADEADGVVRELLQAGAMSYVRKGIAPQELVEKVESSVRARRGQHTQR